MRVFITAVGVVSPLAASARATLSALLAGERAIAPVTRFDVTDLRCQVAAEVRGLSVSDVAPAGQAERLSRAEAFAIAAGKEALDAARLPRGASVDLIVGATSGGMLEAELLLAGMIRDPKTISSDASPIMRAPLDAAAARMREILWPFRRTRTLASACSSGANAVAEAAMWIRSGRSVRALAGGVDAICRLTFYGFNAIYAMDPEPCRPFDARRAGMSLGEGAAFLLLESEEEAARRGAEPIAELAGFAAGSEAKHITLPEESGETAARLIRAALSRARLSPRDVGYVSAHGTATPANDRAEAAAIVAALEGAARDIPVSSIKGHIGHALGAAPAIQAAMTALLIGRGEIPATAGLEVPDPLCPLRHVVGTKERAPIAAALSSSFGFGGAGNVLAITRPRAFEEPSEPREKNRRSVVITGAATQGPLGLGGRARALEHLDQGPPPAPGSAPFDREEHLDLMRARRLDDAGCRLTAAMLAAIRDAGGADIFPDWSRVGLTAGVAMQSGEPSAGFVNAILTAGIRSVKPPLFPTLLASSAAAGASVYIGARGPSLTIVDNATSALAALSTAAGWIEAGEIDAALAGAAATLDSISLGAVRPACFGSRSWRGPETDGASALVIEAAPIALARGASILAEIVWRDGGASLDLRSIPAPLDARSAILVLPRSDVTLEEALAKTSWAAPEIRRSVIAARAGDHEALGGIALAAAAAALALPGARASEALIIDRALDHEGTRWEAALLRRSDA